MHKLYSNFFFPSISDTRLTWQVKPISGDKQQIILNCSAIRLYKRNAWGFRFYGYSCSTTKWHKTPQGSANTLYTSLLDDGTTCQLIIPKAMCTKADFKNYQCQVKFKTIYHCILCTHSSEINIPNEGFTTTLFGETPITTLDEIQNDRSNTVTKWKHLLLVVFYLYR